MQSLILLPGLACDAEIFAAQVPALEAAGWRVHVSDAHTRCNSLPAMATALLTEQPGSHVLIGHSMGGMVALEMARQAPQRVRGMALLGSTARADTPEMIELRTKACELYAAGRMGEVLAANAMLALHPVHAADRALVQRYLAIVSRGGPGQLIRQNRAVMDRADSRPLLPQLRCPVLVATGEADRLVPVSIAREIAAAVTGSRLEIVPGAGHMLTMEQPARVTALLLDWLKSLG